MLVLILFIGDHVKVQNAFNVVPRKRREAAPPRPLPRIPVLPCELARIIHICRERGIYYQLQRSHHCNEYQAHERWTDVASTEWTGKAALPSAVTQHGSCSKYRQQPIPLLLFLLMITFALLKSKITNSTSTFYLLTAKRHCNGTEEELQICFISIHVYFLHKTIR